MSARATSLQSFLDQTTNAEASKFFEEEAKTSKTEGSGLWSKGICAVVVAAGISVLPLLAHYFYLIFGYGPSFSTSQILGVHVSGAVGLGTLAGVILARAGLRDRNRQRNTDLSVALKMMYSYAQQIENMAERQAFIQANGRLILEVSLRQDSLPPSDDGGGLAARFKN